jgi:Caspase domain
MERAERDDRRSSPRHRRRLPLCPSRYPPLSVAACLSIAARRILSRMGTKSRETIYGASVRAAAERATEARKEADWDEAKALWTDLDKRAIDEAVQAFGRELQGADVAMFYYAGHGVQIHGSNYLVPIDANPTREADVDFQMLDVQRSRPFREVRASFRIIRLRRR